MNVQISVKITDRSISQTRAKTVQSPSRKNILIWISAAEKNGLARRNIKYVLNGKFLIDELVKIISSLGYELSKIGNQLVIKTCPDMPAI